MQKLIELAEKFAQAKGTKIIAISLKEDDTVVFVVEAGGKYRMNADQLLQELTTMELLKPVPAEPKPFEYIEEAVKEENEHKSKKKGSK